MIQSDCSTHTFAWVRSLHHASHMCQLCWFWFCFRWIQKQAYHMRDVITLCANVLYFFCCIVVITSTLASFIICFCLHKLKMTRPRNVFLPFVFKQLIDLKIYSQSIGSLTLVVQQIKVQLYDTIQLASKEAKNQTNDQINKRTNKYTQTSMVYYWPT